MKNENFVQIPNKMFADTNNDEKLVYAILQYTQQEIGIRRIQK